MFLDANVHTFVDTINLLLLHCNKATYHICTCVMIAESVAAFSLTDTTTVFLTLKVFPGAWTAVMLSLDSPGFWNVRTENLDTWYLGQETYIRVVDPNGGYNVTEMVAPDNMLYCGLLKDKQKYDICLSYVLLLL